MLEKMVWFFKKKKEQPTFDHQRELAFIHENLKESFLHIKQDMKIMKDWISHLNDRDNDRASAIQKMDSRIEGLGETLAYINLAQEQQSEVKALPEQIVGKESLVLPEKGVSFDLLDVLTDTQRAMFHRAGVLLKEAGQEWLAIKTLAGEVYPNKVYDQVRSTISEYVGVLVDNGLLEKRRRGKQTYVGLTKKGEQFFQKVKGAPLKKEVTKKARKA